MYRNARWKLRLSRQALPTCRFAELDGKPDAIHPIVEAAGRGNVTLLYSAHDTEHNNAVALKEYLSKRLQAIP